jgi:ribosomal protein S18 acetylase RimI-like enzyme
MEKEIKITSLTKDRLDEATALLLAAFKDEAFTSSWLDLSDPKLKKAYATTVKIKYLVHLDSGEPFYAAMDKERVVGIAVLTIPNTKKNKLKSAVLIIKNLPGLLIMLPPALRVARSALEATKPPSGLPEDYGTLEAIAVDPGHQGRGIGRLLLDHAHRNLFNEQNISGIYLVTGDKKNVAVYERFGYETLEKRDTKGFISYHMFLPKRNNVT